MGVVDANDFPMQLQHKGDGAPLPDQINFTIGAGVSPELAAQYGADRAWYIRLGAQYWRTLLTHSSVLFLIGTCAGVSLHLFAVRVEFMFSTGM